MEYMGSEIIARDKLQTLGFPLVPGNSLIINKAHTMMARIKTDSEPSNTDVSYMDFEDIIDQKSYEIDTGRNDYKISDNLMNIFKPFDDMNSEDVVYIDIKKLKKIIKIFDGMTKDGNKMYISLSSEGLELRDSEIDVKILKKSEIENNRNCILSKKYINDILKISDDGTMGMFIYESDNPIMFRFRVHGYNVDLVVAPIIENL